MIHQTVDGQLTAECDTVGCCDSLLLPLQVSDSSAARQHLEQNGWLVLNYQNDPCPATFCPQHRPGAGRQGSRYVQLLIAEECDALKEMLLEKNKAYGSSFSDPLRVFSKAEPDEQINVRLDDKLSRLARGSAAGEDVELDLMGYLVLKRVLRKMRGGV